MDFNGPERKIGGLRKAGIPLEGKIKVICLSGSDLAAKNKLSGKSDPYCVVNLIEGGKKIVHFKTDVAKGTVNPNWAGKTSFEVPIKNDLPAGSSLVIECFDKELIGSDHHMGQVVFHLDDMLHSFEGNITGHPFQLEPHKPGDKVSGQLNLIIEYLNDFLSSFSIISFHNIDDEQARDEKKQRFIKEMQAKSRAEEGSRSAQGLDKVQHFESTNRKEGIEKLRHSDYNAYVHLCRQNGSTPLPPN